MTPDQANELLKVASVYDGRKPSELAADVWAADLSDAGVDPLDAAHAIRAHYRDRPDTWIKPGHVIALAREARRARTANDAAQAAIEAYDLPDVVDPRTVAPRIIQMLADARARVAARDAQAAQDGPERPDGGYGHPVPLRTGRDDFSGPVRQACQNDRDHAGGDWCPGWLIFDGQTTDTACDTCGARSGIYANTDPACPRQDGWN